MNKTFYKKAGCLSGFLLISVLALNVHAQDSSTSTSSSTNTNSSNSTNTGSSNSTNTNTNSSSSFNSGSSTNNNVIPIDQGKFSQPRFKLSASLNEGYDDNTLTTKTNRNESGFTDFQVNGFADLGNPRTLFTIGATAGVNYYYSRPGEKLDKLASLTLNLAQRVNEKFTLTLNTFFTYQVEPDFTLQVEQNRINGQYFYTGDSLSGGYQWTRRFQTVTSYQFVGIFYQDAAARITDDYYSHIFENDLRFQLYPTTTLVATYQLTLTNYLYLTGRNTVTNAVLGGLDHSFSPKFTVSLRAGGQFQTQEGTSGSATSPYAEATLTYLYRRSSSVQGYLHYGFEYSNLTLGQTDKALRTGITFNHSFTPKLTANLGMFYEHDDFSDVAGTGSGAYTEDTININAGLKFALTPKFTLSLSYLHTSLLSDQSALEYDRDVVSIGGTYSF